MEGKQELVFFPELIPDESDNANGYRCVCDVEDGPEVEVDEVDDAAVEYAVEDVSCRAANDKGEHALAPLVLHHAFAIAPDACEDGDAHAEPY